MVRFLSCLTAAFLVAAAAHAQPASRLDEIIKRGIIDQISPRHAARLLKRGISVPTLSAPG